MRWYPLVIALLVLTACTETAWQQAGRDVLAQLNGTGGTAPLSLTEIDAGLREALRVGSERVVTQVGRPDGFYADAAIHIPLPKKLADARDFAARFGLARAFNDIELKLNRAAEKAAPKAKALFWKAIGELRMQDVRQILDGPEDAATRYFEGKMTPELARTLRPVINQSLDEVGAIRSFNRALADYNALPFAPRIEADLSGYVVERSMAGIFHYLAREEAAIRHDPLKRTSERLRRVFGAS